MIHGVECQSAPASSRSVPGVLGIAVPQLSLNWVRVVLWVHGRRSGRPLDSVLEWTDSDAVEGVPGSSPTSGPNPHQYLADVVPVLSLFSPATVAALFLQVG